jgi:hypothetical protein
MAHLDEKWRRDRTPRRSKASAAEGIAMNPWQTWRAERDDLPDLEVPDYSWAAGDLKADAPKDCRLPLAILRWSNFTTGVV